MCNCPKLENRGCHTSLFTHPSWNKIPSKVRSKRENLNLDQCVCEEISSQLFLLSPLPNASLSGWCHQFCRWCHRCVLWLPNVLPFSLPSTNPASPPIVCVVCLRAGLRSEGTQEVPEIRLVRMIPFLLREIPDAAAAVSPRRAAAAAFGFKEWSDFLWVKASF